MEDLEILLILTYVLIWILSRHLHRHGMADGHAAAHEAVDQSHCVVEPVLGQTSMFVEGFQAVQQINVLLDAEDVRIVEEVEE